MDSGLTKIAMGTLLKPIVMVKFIETFQELRKIVYSTRNTSDELFLKLTYQGDTFVAEV